MARAPIAKHSVDGALALWRMDESSGNALDIAGNSLDLTETGTLTAETGVFDGARGSIGALDYFTRADDATKLRFQAFTIAMWLKVPATSPPFAAWGIIGKGFASGAVYHDLTVRIGSPLDPPTGNFQLEAAVNGVGPPPDYTPDYAKAVTPSALTAGWHHICVTWRFRLIVYVDGVAVAIGEPQTEPGLDLQWDTSVWNVGGFNMVGGGGFPDEDGIVDDLVIYPTEKTPLWVETQALGEELFYVDFTEAAGTHYNLFAKIDGLEPILWQYSSYGEPSDWTRSIKTCLRSASELSTNLDLAEMRSGLDTMSFYLDDIDDTDGNSYFGKLFAPARFDTAAHQVLAPGTAYGQQVDADATSIPLSATTGLAASGTAHIGQESIAYTGVDGDGLTGCTRGQYPCVGTNWSYTYERPQEGGNGHLAEVSVYPYTWLGRRVALYCVQWLPEQARWSNESTAELLWVGRATNKIVSSARERHWVLSCTSVLSDLDRTICGSFPTGTLQQQKINLYGTHGRYFEVLQYDSIGQWINKGTITVPQGAYSTMGLCAAINAELADQTNWSMPGGNTPPELQFIALSYEQIALMHTASQYDRVVFYPAANYHYCHALAAIGFGGLEPQVYEVSDTDEVGWFRATLGAPFFTSYQPLHPNYNGGRLYVDDVGRFWADQGDNDSAHANIKIADAILDEYGTKGSYLARYTDLDSATDKMSIDLVHNLYDMTGSAYVGQRVGEPAVEIQNVYIPRYITTGKVRHGPFQMLLYPMLSSATTDYNDSTYDKAPVDLSVAIQASLVDTDSFLEADAAIATSPLAQRKLYLIDSSIKFSELLQRECKMFGYAAVWRDGKISLANIAAPPVDRYTVDLDESTRVSPDEWPDSDTSIDTVINQHVCEVVYNPTTGKYGNKVIVTDVGSVTGLQVTKTVDLKHPGVWTSATTGAPIKDLLVKSLASSILRLPSSVVRIGLAHTLIKKVWVGDVVRFVSTRVSDPSGTGTRSTTVLATVLGVRWNYTDHHFTGSCTLLLHSWNNGMAGPWGPSALVDRSQDGGDWAYGYNATDKQLQLVANEFSSAGDTDDGAAFINGDVVIVQERAPADPAAPDTHTVSLAKAYEADGAGIMTLNAAMATFDGSAAEYVVVHAGYGSVVTAQKLLGTWQAGSDTRLLDGTDTPDRYS